MPSVRWNRPPFIGRTRSLRDASLHHHETAARRTTPRANQILRTRMTDRHPQPASLPIDMLADQIKRSHIISHHTKLPDQQQKWGQGRANPRSDPDSPGGFGTRQGRFWNAGLAGSCFYYRRWWKRPGGRPEKHAASSFIHSMLINVLTTSRMSTC